MLDQPRAEFKEKDEEDDDGDSGRLDQMAFIAVYAPATPATFRRVPSSKAPVSAWRARQASR